MILKDIKTIAAKGSCKRCYLFTCAICGVSELVYGSESWPATQKRAQEQARKHGWCRTDQGWVHLKCE